MAWEVIEHKRENTKQGALLSILIKEIAKAPWYTYSEMLIDHIHRRLPDIKQTNAFRAEYAYKGVPKGLKTVELWKITPFGEMKDKLFTLNYQPESN